jgi:peroxiredoxin/uncharacterized membrane protein YphA (DoxX/SURF4 family)
MGPALLICRALLAGVFLIAGVAKLADLAGSRRAVGEFGVPERLADAVGVALPVAELAVAAALIPTASARFGAVGAAMLLVFFIAAIASAMARGRTPDCHCFGQIHSAPAGWSALTRNVVLVGVACFVAVAGWSDGGASATAWIGRLDGVHAWGLLGGAVLAAAVVFLSWFSLQLLRQQGRLLLRLESLEEAVRGGGDDRVARRGPPGLAVGSVAPAFSLPALDGEVVTLESLRTRERPVLLVFTDPGCGPCEELLPDVGRWVREHDLALTVALVSRGSIDENTAKLVQHGLELVLLQRDREVASAYLAHGTPSAVLISADGRVASPLARGADEVRTAVAAATATPHVIQVAGGNGNGAVRADLAISEGEQAPDFALPDVEGKLLALGDLRGHPTLLLFWRPSCGFCQAMLEDLRDFDAGRSSGAPELVVISSGSPDEHRTMGLRAPVLSDDGGQVMAAYGAYGTPSALIVDAEGRIGSELAAGATAAFDLAGAKRKQVA